MEVLTFNEYQRLQFFDSFAGVSSLREEQIALLEPEEVEMINVLAMQIIWGSMERRNAIDCGGVPVEEMYRKYEESIVPLEAFVLENCSKEDLFALQEAIWHRVVRLVGEKKLMNAVDVVALYDSVNKPYFRLSWLDACALRKAKLIDDP